MWEAQLKTAVEKKTVVTFLYKDEVRTVEPHMLGYHTDGELHLSAWQTSGKRPDWRDFHAAKISLLSTTDTTFARARPGYNPNDPAFRVVLVRV